MSQTRRLTAILARENRQTCYAKLRPLLDLSLRLRLTDRVVNLQEEHVDVGSRDRWQSKRAASLAIRRIGGGRRSTPRIAGSLIG